MKRRVAMLVLVLAMIMAVPTYAAETRAAIIQPGLSFSGTKANCSLIVAGDLGNDYTKSRNNKPCDVVC